MKKYKRNDEVEMSIEEIRQDITDLYGEITMELVWDYCENYGLDLSPDDLKVYDEDDVYC